jgi:hypothetical protein
MYDKVKEGRESLIFQEKKMPPQTDSQKIAQIAEKLSCECPRKARLMAAIMLERTQNPKCEEG